MASDVPLHAWRRWCACVLGVPLCMWRVLVHAGGAAAKQPAEQPTPFDCRLVWPGQWTWLLYVLGLPTFVVLLIDAQKPCLWCIYVTTLLLLITREFHGQVLMMKCCKSPLHSSQTSSQNRASTLSTFWLSICWDHLSGCSTYSKQKHVSQFTVINFNASKNILLMHKLEETKINHGSLHVHDLSQLHRTSL
jgi:hypothetical protein